MPRCGPGGGRDAQAVRKLVTEGPRRRRGSPAIAPRKRSGGSQVEDLARGRKPWTERGCASVVSKSGRSGSASSKAPAVPPGMRRSGPPRPVTEAPSGVDNRRPGDRREARMPLPARVEHAAETRLRYPSGLRGRSPVTRGLAAMPAPFCCVRFLLCGADRLRTPDHAPAGALPRIVAQCAFGVSHPPALAA
jgi:hypothetical protein